MNYKLVYTNRAFKDIKKLPPEIKKRIGNTLLRYQQDPHRHSVAFRDSNLGDYRFRVGVYRIIFDLADSEIVVLRVGHRRDIYKKF